MRKFFLITLASFFCISGHSQQLTRHLGDSVYFVMNTSVKDSLALPSVELRLDTICFHEHSLNNSSIAEFWIVNNTSDELFVQKELTCWDDSGFPHPELPAPDARHKILPGDRAKIRVKINGTRKNTWSKSGYFGLLNTNGKLFVVPVSLRLLMLPEKCGQNEGETGRGY